ncbi:ribosome maturation factor RimP [Solimonas sp. K1W22B-7]|uniref:ribosome maturation factor RimP n=1 Tax=Solimonas sp. K1W22B-7 TaxID=2303331 RepID=UPI000E337BF1|nr:ribosome maturation factor RimP [Solimonas sp. K1W22B-7]AXQ29202.1 ribosome maturation factor RimP [Solimonas sp. K1W22B-7]
MTVLRERLVQLLEPVVESMGYELVLLEYSPNSHNALLRLFIDSAGGIGLEDCEKVSREVAAQLDVEDPISTPYSLEVSSPGLDRPLAKPAHFERFMNEQARIQLLAPKNGRRRYIGWIRAVGDRAVTLETEQGSIEFEYSEMERARLVPDYDRE